MAKEKSCGCCQVEAVVTVDARGQMVLPKETRRRMGIQPGEKLTVALCGEDESSYCIVLMKVNELEGMVRGRLGPVVNRVHK